MVARLSKCRRVGILLGMGFSSKVESAERGPKKQKAHLGRSNRANEMDLRGSRRLSPFRA
jgi:hypothetical protein